MGPPPAHRQRWLDPSFRKPVSNGLTGNLKDEFNASDALLGVSVGVTCVSEIPLFYLSSLIVERLGTGQNLPWATAPPWIVTIL